MMNGVGSEMFRNVSWMNQRDGIIYNNKKMVVVVVQQQPDINR